MLLRITVGGIYLTQAYLALFVATPRGTASFIEKMGFPAPTLLALLVIAIHGIGGAMLVAGMLTRAAAVLNAAVLLVGMLAVYLRQGHVPRGALIDTATGRAPGYEYVALLVAATIAITTLGGGGSGASGSARAK